MPKITHTKLKKWFWGHIGKVLGLAVFGFLIFPKKWPKNDQKWPKNTLISQKLNRNHLFLIIFPNVGHPNTPKKAGLVQKIEEKQQVTIFLTKKCSGYWTFLCPEVVGPVKN